MISYIILYIDGSICLKLYNFMCSSYRMLNFAETICPKFCIKSKFFDFEVIQADIILDSDRTICSTPTFYVDSNIYNA